MAKIAPLTGTTADYNAVEDNLILADREIGVEIASRTRKGVADEYDQIQNA